MSDPWPTLRAAGVPLAGPKADAPFDARRVARAARSALASAQGVEREALDAWLCAWASHWPTSYRLLIGVETSHGGEDPGRHVKLRRIAMARLAVLL